MWTSARSLMPAHSISARLWWAERNAARPTRPKPLIATRVGIAAFLSDACASASERRREYARGHRGMRGSRLRPRRSHVLTGDQRSGSSCGRRVVRMKVDAGALAEARAEKTRAYVSRSSRCRGGALSPRPGGCPWLVRNHLERPHHFVVLVLEDVAVIGVVAEVVEAARRSRTIWPGSPARCPSSPFRSASADAAIPVSLSRFAGRDVAGDVEVLPVEDLELHEVQVHRVRVAGRVDEAPDLGRAERREDRRYGSR